MSPSRIIGLLIVSLAFNLSAISQTLEDRFGKLLDDDIYARIDNFCSLVERKPDSIGHAVFHKQTGEPLGAFLRYFHGVERVWKSRGCDPARLVMHAGEDQDEPIQEFWLALPGQVFRPDATDLQNRLTQKLIGRTLFDYQCIGCDPAVFLKLWIFRDGLDYAAAALKANPHSFAEYVIGINAYVSGTLQERRDLRKEIIGELRRKSGNPHLMVAIRFVRHSMFAKAYLVARRY